MKMSEIIGKNRKIKISVEIFYADVFKRLLLYLHGLKTRAKLYA